MQQKQFKLNAEDIRPLLSNWQGNAGCVATDRITVNGEEVGYMYREEPAPNIPDSGWRFFAGDEDDEYIGNTDNSGIFHLNTICNFDTSIIPLLESPYGSIYYKDADGVFQLEPIADDE